MIIEVIPFFHIMAAEIVARVGDGEGSDRVIIATTMVAFALSSILTGELALGSERFKPRLIKVLFSDRY